MSGTIYSLTTLFAAASLLLGALEVVAQEPVVRVISKDAIPAIDRPIFVDADEADFMDDNELVIGVSDGLQSKAYSTRLLDTHEIVNDRIGATPIAVTWCPLCFTAITYARHDGEQELTFGVSGYLWRENLVMYDRQTDSWWSQASGESIRGPKAGRRLRMYPSDMMTWKQWRTLHPETLVLSKRVSGRLEGMRDTYRSYHQSGEIGVTGRLRGLRRALGFKEQVAGFTLNGTAYAVPLDDLDDDPVLQTSADDQGLLIVGTPDERTAKIFLTNRTGWSYSRTERGRVILKDASSGAEWDGFTGKPLDDNETGEQLLEVPANVSYWFAWALFYPESRVIKR